ncbi:hybrid sensor histidine kinase/response regulator [Algoriphagus sp.]|uniref:response regulator n=1 Tax=Algoriphagus sp. TaxID=1872435 RepID=UPI0025ED8C43|nr:hybrid sensor histidine kinase/response regulator [Algoriphagus sp.]
MKSKRVLIVDDNDINRKLFENLIGQICLYKSAKNGIEALKMIQEDKFDLILMDIQMPQMDGITAMKQVRLSNHSECPIVAVTAFAEIEDRNSFLEQGFDEFLVKPIRPKSLLECINKFLVDQALPSNGVDEVNNSPIEQVILDLKVLNQLLKYNKVETIRTIYLEFLDECETLVQDSIKSFNKSDLRIISENLHVIKGNSGTLGANKIFLLSIEGEQSALDENWLETKKTLHSLQNEIQNFKNYILEETIFIS